MTQSPPWPTGLQSPDTIHWDWPLSPGLGMTKEGRDLEIRETERGEERGKGGRGIGTAGEWKGKKPLAKSPFWKSPGLP